MRVNLITDMGQDVYKTLMSAIGNGINSRLEQINQDPTTPIEVDPFKTDYIALNERYFKVVYGVTVGFKEYMIISKGIDELTEDQFLAGVQDIMIAKGTWNKK